MSAICIHDYEWIGDTTYFGNSSFSLFNTKNLEGRPDSLFNFHCQSFRKPHWRNLQSIFQQRASSPRLLITMAGPGHHHLSLGLLTVSYAICLLSAFATLYFQCMLKQKSYRCHSYNKNTSVHSHLIQHKRPSSKNDFTGPYLLCPYYFSSLICSVPHFVPSHWPLCSFFHMPGKFLPQDLCTCCSLWLACSFPRYLSDSFPDLHQVFTQMSFSQWPLPALKLQHTVRFQPISTLCPDILFHFFQHCPYHHVC